MGRNNVMITNLFLSTGTIVYFELIDVIVYVKNVMKYF